jgi:hypothetical protein
MVTSHLRVSSACTSRLCGDLLAHCDRGVSVATFTDRATTSETTSTPATSPRRSTRSSTTARSVRIPLPNVSAEP